MNQSHQDKPLHAFHEDKKIKQNKLQVEVFGQNAKQINEGDKFVASKTSREGRDVAILVRVT